MIRNRCPACGEPLYRVLCMDGVVRWVGVVTGRLSCPALTGLRP